jgi:hypothetical protein
LSENLQLLEVFNCKGKNAIIIKISNSIIVENPDFTANTPSDVISSTYTPSDSALASLRFLFSAGDLWFPSLSLLILAAEA